MILKVACETSGLRACLSARNGLFTAHELNWTELSGSSRTGVRDILTGVNGRIGIHVLRTSSQTRSVLVSLSCKSWRWRAWPMNASRNWVDFRSFHRSSLHALWTIPQLKPISLFGPRRRCALMVHQRIRSFAIMRYINLHRESKKTKTLLPITSPNIGRFSKFFHY